MNKKLDLTFTKAAIGKLVDFVKPTYGPRGNKVILKHGNELMVLDDGVTIAELFKTDDEYENAVNRLAIEVARRTNKRVGDGTTGSLILTKGLMDAITSESDLDTLGTAKTEAIEALKSQAKKIETLEDVRKVAYMAYKNDKMADLIAEVVHKLGEEAIIALEESPNLETTYTVEDGIQFERGYVSPYMVNDKDRMEAVWEHSPILLTDRKIESVMELVPLCERLANAGETRLVIIAADFLGDTIPTFASNIAKGKFKVLAVRAPGFAHRMRGLLEDMAAVTGGEVIGAELEGANFNDAVLGTAEKVISTFDHTTIVNGGGTKEALEAHLTSIRNEIEAQPTEFDQARLKERIARLTTGVAIIKVGASTESEMKAIKYKVEDAMNAAKAALKGGVVLGGGKTLTALSTSSPVLNEALKQPENVLKENGGQLDEVYDPVDVLIASIESAVSVAILLTDAKGIIVE